MDTNLHTHGEAAVSATACKENIHSPIAGGSGGFVRGALPHPKLPLTLQACTTPLACLCK